MIEKNTEQCNGDKFLLMASHAISAPLRESSTGRDTSIDIAKGIAIIAIVLGHVQRGLTTSGVLDARSDYFLYSDRALYLVHLSVFAFLSGLFVQGGVRKSGRNQYLRSRVALFLYLYVLWSLLQGAVSLVLASQLDSPPTLLDIFRLWEPESQLWFFPWIAVQTVAVVLLRPWGNTARTAAVLALSVIVSLAFWGVFGVYFGAQGLGLTAFFFTGVALGAGRYTAVREWLGDRGWLAPMGIAGAGIYGVLLITTHAIGPTSAGGYRTPLNIALGVVASVAGMAAVLVASAYLARSPWASKRLGALGRHSLEIFVAHIFAVTAVRVLLNKADISSAPVHIIAGTIAGLALPLLLWWICEKINFPWFFTAPAFLTGVQRP